MEINQLAKYQTVWLPTKIAWTKDLQILQPRFLILGKK